MTDQWEEQERHEMQAEWEDAIMAENTKLRELLGELYQCSRQVGCDHCGEGYRRICSSLSRMRELGIEVE